VKLQHCARSRNRPTANDDKNTGLVDFCGWYSFGKITKIVATRCRILNLKCTKFDFRGGCAPDPAGGAYSAPLGELTALPRPRAGFKGPASKRREGEVEGVGVDTAWSDI